MQLLENPALAGFFVGRCLPAFGVFGPRPALAGPVGGGQDSIYEVKYRPALAKCKIMPRLAAKPD
jgi:hypothetical protein